MNANMSIVDKIMSRSCAIAPDNELWTVSGVMVNGMGGGILAWCYDEDDAKHAKDEIAKDGRFKNLSIEKFISG
jgi:hypothetical protein